MKHILIFLLILTAALPAAAQERDYFLGDQRPYNPATDLDIDMFMGSWRENDPYLLHGNLIARDILTRSEGDQFKPVRRGAVLKYANRFAHIWLEAHDSSLPDVLEGEQEIYYCLSGAGEVTGGGKTFPVYPEVSFMIPEGLEFTIHNTGAEDLTFYMVSEPTILAENFKPGESIVWHDEADSRVDTANGHWVHVNKFLVGRNEGCADLELVLTVRILPGAFAQPHVHDDFVEEVWCPINDGIKVMLGKEFRDLPAGMAYKVPPNGITPHSNINVTDTAVKFFYFARGWNKTE